MLGLRKLPRIPGLEVEVGCLVQLAAMLAVAIADGVVIGTRLQTGPVAPREAVVRGYRRRREAWSEGADDAGRTVAVKARYLWRSRSPQPSYSA